MLDKYQMSMGATKLYKCAGNVFWQSWQPAQRGIPVSARAVYEYAAHYFPDPRPFKHDIVVVVDGKTNPLERKGSLERVSPEEPLLAWLVAVCRDLDNNAPNTRIDQWVHTALTATFLFQELQTDDEKFYMAANLREAGLLLCLFMVPHDVQWFHVQTML